MYYYLKDQKISEIFEIGSLRLRSPFQNFVTLENVDSFVGNTYLVTTFHEYVYQSPTRIKEVYRIDGYEICQGEDDDITYLTPNGFKRSMQIYDRDFDGSHIYAYEKTKKYKTFKESDKIASKNNAWISLLVVQCCYDKRRKPHFEFIDKSEMLEPKIEKI